MIELFSPDATRAVVADWIEIELYTTDRNGISDVDVTRAEGILSDAEHGAEDWGDDLGGTGDAYDAEILEPKVEARRASTYEELHYRQAALGELYPFVLTKSPTGGWRLKRRTSTDKAVRCAHWVYLATLAMSAFRHHHVGKASGQESVYETLQKGIAERFQEVSTLTASNLLGDVYWFGWPRPDRSHFRDALQDLLQRLGHGRLRDDIPNNSWSVEDGSVDLVAWAGFGDRTYGSLVLFGQVASGNNWPTKPVFSHIKGQFLDHCSDSPTEHYLGATFIPFLLHTDVASPRVGSMADAIVHEARQLERDHGSVIDRLRITELAGRGFGSPDRRHNSPSVYQVAYALIAWVRAFRRYCHDR